MVTTTILAFFVAKRIWRWNQFAAIGLFSVFLVIDTSFLLANAVKIPDGGWFPLVAGSFMYLLMSTWQKGRELLIKRMRATAEPIQVFVQKMRNKPLARVPGVAIFMTGDPDGAPAALLHNIKHNKVLHEQVVILTILSQDVPHVPRSQKIIVTEVEANFHRVMAYYGFMETPNIFEIIALSKEHGLDIPIQEVTFFVGRETILATGKPGMPIWREKLFIMMSRNAQRATAFFQIPADQVIEVGIQVEI
jgi:KUP system potassium uptake protein